MTDWVPDTAAPPPGALSPAVADAPIAFSVVVILVAAGRGRRFGGGDNKVLLPLAGKPVWLHAAQRLAALPAVKHTVLVSRAEDRSQIQPLADPLAIQLVDGGQERYDSVRAGLIAAAAWIAQATAIAATPASPSANTSPQPHRWLVAVHDAARPLVSIADCHAVLQTAAQTGAAILAGPLRGTIKRCYRTGPYTNQVTTIDRSELWEAYTPQVFHLPVLQDAFHRWDGQPVTDDAELVERAGFPVALVPGSAENLKITQPEDLSLAAALLTRHSLPSSL